MPYFALAGLGGVAVWLVDRRHDRWSQAAFVAFAIGTIAFLAVTSTGRGTPFGDFDKAYYPAGLHILSDPSRVYDCAHEDGLCFVNLPVVAVLFAPFASLPLGEAHAIVTAVSLVAIALAAWLMIGLMRASGTQRYAIVALILLNGPLYYSVRLANLTHIVLVLLVIAVGWMLRGQDGRAGSLLACLAIVKPPLLIWLPYFALRRRWGAVMAMTLTLLGVAGVSVALFGLPLHLAWAGQFLLGSSAHPIGAYNVQSATGLLVRLTTSGTLVDWRPIDVGPLFHVAQLGLTLAVLVAALAAGALAGAPRGRAAQLREYSMVVCVMLLVSPVSWTHYYCLLLLPLAAFVSHATDVPQTRRWLLAIGTAAMLVSLPVMLWVPAERFTGALIARVLLSHYVFGAALLLGVLVAASIRVRQSVGRVARWGTEMGMAAPIGFPKGA